MKNTIAVGISIPKKIMMQIDEQRGDVPRSKYILRIIQGRIHPLANLNTKARKQSAVQTASEVHKSSQSVSDDTKCKKEDNDNV